jgi:hypothetical protein
MGLLRKDDGVAAVEFALIFGLLTVVAVMVWPLGEALLQKMAVDRSVTDVIQYATNTPNKPAFDVTGQTSPTNRRPTCPQIIEEYFWVSGVKLPADQQPTSCGPFEYTAANGGQTQVTVSGSPTHAGQTVSITVTKSVPLGPLGDLLSIAGITPTHTVTVSAAASGREE